MSLPETIARVMVAQSARGGWKFYVECAVCHQGDTFDGFVFVQAVDRAVKAGWSIDREAVLRRAQDRDDLCPKHAGSR